MVSFQQLVITLNFKNMKYFSLIVAAITLFLSSSCEEVVNVDLNTATPKLVIEASINWEKGTSGNEQKIKLTTTASFYNTTIPIVSGALITIKNSLNEVFNFIETSNTGEYVCTNFTPVLNENYVLTVIANGETYTASETLKSVAPIVSLQQNNEGGFTGNKIEVKALFNDPANQDNYYLFRYKYPSVVNYNFSTSEDKFFQGNEFFSSSFNNDLKAGDVINIVHFGISKNYYNYLTILLSITGSNGGSPFQSPPSTVRGNVVNQTNFDNFALGYFSLSETDTKNYIVQ